MTVSITFDLIGGYIIENITCELEGCLINNDIMVYLQPLKLLNIIFIMS
jgi:hypothetical protein